MATARNEEREREKPVRILDLCLSGLRRKCENARTHYRYYSGATSAFAWLSLKTLAFIIAALDLSCFYQYLF